MECPSCTFQNTPGTRICVRCHSLLDLDAVDFVPPRASSGRSVRRARAVAQAARFQVRDTVVDIRRAFRLPDDFRVSWWEVAWSLIPGGAQIRSRVRGLRIIGWCVLGLWCVLLVTALACIGSGMASLLSFAAVSVHSFGISLVFAAPLQRQPIFHRLAIGIGLYFAVLFGLYWPASMGLQNLVGVLPVSGVVRQPYIASGDVLLRTSTWTRPHELRRGDIVVVTIDAASAPGVMIASGYGVDRVIAVHGDEVHMAPNELQVNGIDVPPELRPLGGIADLPRADITVGEHEYIVVESIIPWAAHGNYGHIRAGLALQLARVPEDRVLGRVLLRARPWSRFGLVGGHAP